MILTNTIRSQANWQIDARFKAGINLQFGTHIQRIGLMYQTYVHTDFAQLTQGIYAHFQLKNLGPEGHHFELKFQAGAQAQWGWRRKEGDHPFNEFSNLSEHAYAVGYSFYGYLTTNQTTQTGGALYANLEQFRLAIDNDAFGTNPYDDKFRTGAFLVSWYADDFLYSVQSTLWTGKSFDAPKQKGTDYPARKGYRDPSDVLFGKYSHGILAGRVEYFLDYDQVARLELGWDSEHIRNMVQNKMVHDLMPDRWVGYENPHYPMLQQDGTPFLYHPGQKVRKDRLYLQLGGNQAGLY